MPSAPFSLSLKSEPPSPPLHHLPEIRDPAQGLVHDGHLPIFFSTKLDVFQGKKRAVSITLGQLPGQKLGVSCVLSMNVATSVQVVREVSPGLPVPMVDFGCDLLLELRQFVLGECSRQDLGPPLDQAVCHLLQPAEQTDLVVLGRGNEVEKGTPTKKKKKRCDKGWKCLLTV